MENLRFHELEPCMSRVRVYVHALREERRLRRKHDTQFIGVRECHIMPTVDIASIDWVYARI